MDGRDDWGIDAVAVEDRVTHHHITLVQAKWSDKANAGFGHSEVDRLFRGLDLLLNLEFSRFNNRVERHVDALEKALDTGSPKVTLPLALVTGTELHPDIQSLLNHEVGERNWAEEMVDYKVVDRPVPRDSWGARGLKHHPGSIARWRRQGGVPIQLNAAGVHRLDATVWETSPAYRDMRAGGCREGGVAGVRPP
ncbi:hypothetical protein ACWGJW_00410 [Streptomyces nigrescens]